jgi:hypothetical protein
VLVRHFRPQKRRALSPPCPAGHGCIPRQDFAPITTVTILLSDYITFNQNSQWNFSENAKFIVLSKDFTQVLYRLHKNYPPDMDGF